MTKMEELRCGGEEVKKAQKERARRILHMPMRPYRDYAEKSDITATSLPPVQYSRGKEKESRIPLLVRYRQLNPDNITLVKESRVIKLSITGPNDCKF